MSENFKELIDIYENILNATLEINSLIKNGEINNIALILNKREAFIKKADKILINNSFNEEEKKEINSFVEKIKPVDKENMDLLIEGKNLIAKKLSKTNISYKAINAYKYKKELDPRLIDSKE